MKIYPCPFKDKNFKRNPQNLNWTLLGEDDFQILQKTSKKNGQNLAGSLHFPLVQPRSFVGKTRNIGRSVDVGVQFLGGLSLVGWDFAGFHHNQPETMGHLGMIFANPIPIVMLVFGYNEVAT